MVQRGEIMKRRSERPVLCETEEWLGWRKTGFCQAAVQETVQDGQARNDA